MPKKIKLDLEELNVKSFTTGEKVSGGATDTLEAPGCTTYTGGGPNCQTVRTCDFYACGESIPVNGCVY